MKRAVALITASTVAGVAVATARPLEITPYVGAEVTISDNIDLEPRGQEDSAIVTTAYGGFEALYDSPRFSGGGVLELAGDVYHGRDNGRKFDGLRVNANAFGTAEIIPNRAYVDLSGYWRDVLVNSDGRISLNPVAGAGSRTGVGSITISPSYRQPLGPNLQGELRTTHSFTGGASGDVSTEVRNAARASLGTTRPFGRIGFESFAEYSNSQSDENGGLNDLERATAQATVSYEVSPRFALLARGGYDEVDSAGFTEDMSGFSYGAGFRARPTPRSSIEVIVGERYNDLNVEADARYQLTDRITAGVRYYQDVATSSYSESELYQARFLQSLGIFGTPTESQRAFAQQEVALLQSAGFLSTGGTNRVYRSTVLSGYLTGQFNTNRVYLNVFGQERDFDILNPGDPSIDEQSINFVAGWEKQFSSRLTGTAEASYRYYVADNPVTSDTDTYGLRLMADYQLTPTVDIYGGLIHTTRQATFNADEYRENAALVGARARF
ncbi:MAG: TIGR03016 family PEP-CTERM system-associated outer membrane protein [Alphaproteobacteria bacterium]|nr:TIGR03016 family PEP-CTERM system-associated outer membrane protein [Alphaproteobacteria bacterium]MDX5368688.1 TIGR03016 family PEP-CTERM system-associated outer membrane protein [Alphaproteobacteria bacterium]MDX5463430.1 TIGR03016 family PEP-CTERM system-associated outer membrane protein [Alphaproteobacteria bacterium]